MVQGTFEHERLVSDIAERGYAEFEHGIPPDHIDRLVDSYAIFTQALPDPSHQLASAMLPSENAGIEERLDDLDRSVDKDPQWHKYRTNTDGVGKPNGYTNRSLQVTALREVRGLEIGDDPKEFYHWTPAHHVHMVGNHNEFGWGPLPSEVIALGMAFSPIHHRATKLLFKVLALIEEDHPEIRRIVTPQSLRTSPLRLLFYHGSDQGSELGAGHYDKSTITVQIAESHEGLRVAPDSASPLAPVQRQPEKAVIFPGKSLRESLDTPQLETPYQPGWHDIVKVGRLNEGRSMSPEAAQSCVRWALIFFANQQNFIQPDKSATHQR